MRTNVRKKVTTHEGGKAVANLPPDKQLARAVLACLLWEDTFYESGVSIAERIQNLASLVSPPKVAELAVKARIEFKLRHAPLLLVRELARHPRKEISVAEVLSRVIQRTDELTEFVSLYWKDGKQPLAAQVKKGLALAFTKFDEYSLAKYDRETPIKLKDVLFLCHAKPTDEKQAELWKRLIADELKTPDTWEVALSAGKGEDKKATWERLLKENKLGALALMRNLRNMEEASVSTPLIRKGLQAMDISRVLPFRFIAAARYAPRFEPELEQSMLNVFTGMPKLGGRTVVLVDVSGSMDNPISGKSDISRIDAACGVAMCARELSNDVEVLSFSTELKSIPPRRGFALRDAIKNSQSHANTYLGAALEAINAKVAYDRIIVITDEQSHDTVGNPSGGRGYMINVASNEHGVGYGPWVHLDGFSEAVIRYISEYEREMV